MTKSKKEQVRQDKAKTSRKANKSAGPPLSDPKTTLPALPEGAPVIKSFQLRLWFYNKPHMLSS